MSRLQRFWLWCIKNKHLLFILVAACILRFGGTNPGYHHYHSDEPVVYGTAVYLIKNNTLDPGRYDYPATVMVLQKFIFQFVFMPIAWIQYYIKNLPEIISGFIELPLSETVYKKVFQEVILGTREVNALFWGRYITALFSVGNVVLVYLLGKNLWNKRVGLLVALFLTFNYRHVLNSHISLPDIYNSFFVLLSFYATSVLWKFPTRRSYILAGISAGLSVSVKYQIYALFPLVLAHLYVSFSNGKIDLRKMFNTSAIISALLIIVTFLITNPYVFINIEETIRWSHIVFQKYGVGTNEMNLFPIAYLYNIDIGPSLFITSLLGILISIKSGKRFLYLFMPLVYFLYLFAYSSNGGFYVRNVIPITPILLLFAAYFVDNLLTLLETKHSKKTSTVFAAIFLIVLLYIPARNSLINTYYYRKPWNFDVMAQWLKENLPSDAIVAAVPIDVPGGPKMTKTEFELDGNFSLVEHKEAGATWALFNTDWGSNNFYYWMSVRSNTLSYWNKPLDEMRNSYFGLAAEELFRYQVYSVTKPWQAPESNLVIAKIPVWNETGMLRIASYGFNTSLDGWHLFNDPQYALFLHDQEVGLNKDGAVVYVPKLYRDRIVRIYSSPIKIKGGHLYKVTANMLPETEILPNERNGFLRVDFLESESDPSSLGTVSSVSSRVYGSSKWTKKEIIERAPDNVQYMVISFQITQMSRTKIWMDDVEVYESDNVVDDIAKAPPYNYKPIDLDTLYPNSHGNL